MKIHIKRSSRKSIALQVKDSQIVVKAPLFLSDNKILDFVKKHKDWIWRKLSMQANSLIDEDKIPEYKALARKIIPIRVEFLAKKFWFRYNTVKITNAKTRWGSCTNKRNLNFSFRLILTPPEIIDYVICHELAHLKHMNHSKVFREEVSKMDLSYKEHDKWLNDNADYYI